MQSLETQWTVRALIRRVDYFRVRRDLGTIARGDRGEHILGQATDRTICQERKECGTRDSRNEAAGMGGLLVLTMGRGEREM
jgi:hypothetical protein